MLPRVSCYLLLPCLLLAGCLMPPWEESGWADDDDVTSDDDDTTGDDDDATTDDDDATDPLDEDGDGFDSSVDCDDSDPDNFPGNVEACDGQDNDCNGLADATGEAVDQDGDGWPACNDCEDDNADINPAVADVCDGVDNDCDGIADNGFDVDGDGWTTCAGDCNDADPNVYFGAPEDCDAVDSNCDGDLVDTFPDLDLDGDPDCNDPDDDGDGDPDITDCNDTDPAVFTGAAEVCADDQDNDCDGSTPDLWDDDGDGWTCDLDCDDSDTASTALPDDPDCDGVFESMTIQGIDLQLITAGSFNMGCTAGPEASGLCEPIDYPVHSVTLTNDFWMAETEVTQGQWETWFGNNPSDSSACGPDCPVDSVNWFDALTFANAISVAEGLPECFAFTACFGTVGVDLNCSGLTINSPTGSVYDCAGYRLPTEAEWEYAARAGTDLVFAGSDTLDDVAWHPGNASASTHPVATKLPNGWDLYDLTGNVWEWNWDTYAGDYYSSSPAIDPEGPSPPPGWSQVRRGGGWASGSGGIPISGRLDKVPSATFWDIGFRLVRTVP